MEDLNKFALLVCCVRTSQKTQRAVIIKTSRRTLYTVILALYCEYRKERMDILCGQSAEYLVLTLTLRAFTCRLLKG